MARKFLYVIAGLIVFSVFGRMAYEMWGKDLLKMSVVPSAAFSRPAGPDVLDYTDTAKWLARPDKAGNPALWTPQGYQPAAKPEAAVFFIHPTSYIDRARWNAPLTDKTANDRAALFLRGQASAFNEVGAIWAPRYRQATFGAFLTSKKDALEALDFAYQDVSAAFDQFLKEAGNRPIILAGHSQGSLHLTRLLKERVAGTPLAKRIVAAYVIGWPVSRTADLPAMGLPECTKADQAGCLLSWQSFGEPADPSLILDTYNETNGFTGAPRKGTPIVCTNPLTGTPDANAPASANLGTLYPSADLSNATIEAGHVSARCDKGILLIANPPAGLDAYVLPGNNYHVFDYSLFWANVRADAARRMKAFK